MKIEQLKKILLKDKSFKAVYERYDLALEIALRVADLRILKGWTQEDLAKETGTKQPSIARLENGKSLPSLRFLEKIAKAAGTYLISPQFASLEKYELSNNANTTYNLTSNVEVTARSYDSSTDQKYSLLINDSLNIHLPKNPIIH